MANESNDSVSETPLCSLRSEYVAWLPRYDFYTKGVTRVTFAQGSE